MISVILSATTAAILSALQIALAQVRSFNFPPDVCRDDFVSAIKSAASESYSGSSEGANLLRNSSRATRRPAEQFLVIARS